MSSISNLLLVHLDELEQDDFGRFKWSLTSSTAEGFSPIPRSRLENAKQHNVVELMVNQYGESDAANITVQVLKQIKQNKLASELEKKLEGKGVSGNVSGGGPAMAHETNQGKDDYKGAEFVDKHRDKLIQRMTSVMEIADCLLSKRMITAEQYSTVRYAGIPQDQMRKLYESLDAGGRAVKEEFYTILKDKQPYLVQDLGSE